MANTMSSTTTEVVAAGSIGLESSSRRVVGESDERQALIRTTPTSNAAAAAAASVMVDLELAGSTISGLMMTTTTTTTSPQQQQQSSGGDTPTMRRTADSTSFGAGAASPTSVLQGIYDEENNDAFKKSFGYTSLPPSSSSCLVENSNGKKRFPSRQDSSDKTRDIEKTEDKPVEKGSDAALKTMLLTALVVQATSAILTGRYTRSSVPQDELYEISHLVLVIECTKLIMSIAMEYVATQGQLWSSIQKHVIQKPLDSLKVLVPAVMYVIQNSLIYIALSNLNAPFFLALQQGKLITTAIVSVLMLQRSYSIKQWTCLFILAAGVAVVVLDEKKAANGPPGSGNKDGQTATESEQFFFIGLLAVTGACFSSAFAGVYFEKVLAPEKAAPPKPSHAPSLRGVKAKRSAEGGPLMMMMLATSDATKSTQPSLWMRNMQLAFFSIICARFQGALEVHWDSTGDNADRSSKSYLHGFTCWVWLLVALQAFGGLLVAAVMKYADNVLKGVAMGVSVVVASLVSTVLFDVHLSSHFALGATVIFVSVYCFSNDLPNWTLLLQSLKALV